MKNDPDTNLGELLPHELLRPLSENLDIVTLGDLVNEIESRGLTPFTTSGLSLHWKFCERDENNQLKIPNVGPDRWLAILDMLDDEGFNWEQYVRAEPDPSWWKYNIERQRKARKEKRVN